MTTSIGRKIRELILSHNMTQEQLGRVLGVNKSAVQKYESGDVQNLKRETIKRLCNQFRVYPYAFIFEPGDYWLETECLAAMEDQLDKIKEKFKLTASESQDVMDFFRKKNALNEHGFRKVLEYMDDIAHSEKYKRKA